MPAQRRPSPSLSASRADAAPNAGEETSAYGPPLEEVRREDDELLGYVRANGKGWQALTIFHAPLGSAPARTGAVRVVRERGLSSLAERWHWFSRADGTWRIVLPQESRPGWVRLWVGYYPGPGTPQATVTGDDLAAGDQLTLNPPPGVEIDPGL